MASGFDCCSTMQIFVGTSGYSYPKWKGSFYPAKLPQKEMLSYYAQRLSTVEINNSFYRMPTEGVRESCAEQVPNGFQFGSVRDVVRAHA
jgi:uncharacterized protein YecE (DUF72 family)